MKREIRKYFELDENYKLNTAESVECQENRTWGFTVTKSHERKSERPQLVLTPTVKSQKRSNKLRETEERKS